MKLQEKECKRGQKEKLQRWLVKVEKEEWDFQINQEANGEQ